MYTLKCHEKTKNKINNRTPKLFQEFDHFKKFQNSKMFSEIITNRKIGIKESEESKYLTYWETFKTKKTIHYLGNLKDWRYLKNL